MYGSFPYYVQMINGTAHGAMLMNSNGMDVTLADTSLTFKPIGGIVDLYVFSGSTPAAVVDQYTQIVGRPTMMPYWSLGFHNCKYGYESIWQVEQVVANYSAAGIPLDTQWMDIDYMQNYKDFTLDSVDFPQSEVASFVNQLHANGQHFVPIIDPGIMVQSGYDAYEQGVQKDLFVKDIQGGYYLGQVWPGPTYFPDFLHPSTQDYWTQQLKAFWNMAQPDGLWIDMNEVGEQTASFLVIWTSYAENVCVAFVCCRCLTSATRTAPPKCAPTRPRRVARPPVPARPTAAWYAAPWCPKILWTSRPT
jgi:alpha-glucosidase (family GH31 glycosyl hydrolase)